MTGTVLFVDDDKAILDYARELFKRRGCRLVTAAGGDEALLWLEREEVAVLVTDHQMPGMSGLELLAKAELVSPDTVKIMTTAYGNLALALSAINRSELFRFILKPWQGDEMVNAVKDGLRRYRTLKAMQQEQESVLLSLAQTIELKDPDTRGHCDRVAEYAVRLAEALALPKEMLREIRHGSWLHDCGKIGVPEQVLNAKRQLRDEEFDLVKKHSSWGAEVATTANLSPVVVNIILYHHERFDGQGYPTGLAGKDIPVEARIVAVADVYDALSSDRPYRPRFSREKTLEMLRSMRGSVLDPALVDLLASLEPA